jgi:Inner membrane component of T3SS, cytoplasmic domain
MSKLTLEWQEENILKNFIFQGQDRDDRHNSIKIGRDPARCDLVLTHPTVSALHVKIRYDDRAYQFYLSNLRETNPPIVNGQKVCQGEIPLTLNSQIYLGKVLLIVKLIQFDSPARIIIPQPKPQVQAQIQPITSTQGQYQLKCSGCGRNCPYDWIDLGCQWCGTSLSAAASILIPPKH